MPGHGGLTGVCVAAVSLCMAHCLKPLSFGSIQLQPHLVEAFLESWHADVEMWGRWLRKEVGCAQDYIVSYISKWDDWQPTCTFNSSWILLRIGALRITAGDSNGHAICSRSVRCCLFVYRDTSRWTTAVIACLIYIKDIFFDGKDIWWCLSQDIVGIFHESHSNHQVVLATDPGYPGSDRVRTEPIAPVWVWTAKQPAPPGLGMIVTRTGHKRAGIWPGWTRTPVLIYGSYHFGTTLAPIK